MTRLRSLFNHWYEDAGRPVLGPFSGFDISSVAAGIGALATWAVLSFGGWV